MRWLTWMGVVWAVSAPLLNAQVPALVSYQGRVTSGGTNFTGSGQFKFALVGATTNSLWSHNGSSVAGSEPSTSLTLAVDKGLFAVLLGDTSVGGMTLAIPPAIFTNAEVRLRVWFSDGGGFQQLAPDQRLAAAGYALNAASAQTAQGVVFGGITASMLATGAVTSVAIADGAIGAADLGSGAVTAASIAAGAVTTAALADGAVTAVKLKHVVDVVAFNTITNPAPAPSDLFGFSVAGVGANRFVVGAAFDDIGASGAGTVYQYDFNGTLLSTVTNPAPAAGDNFGSSVAGVGTNRFVVGANSDDAGASNAGSAYLYDFSGALLAAITNPAPAVNDIFGISVAGVGTNRFVVGAENDDAGAANAGSAYLYDFSGTLLATITNPAPGVNEFFGHSVAGVGTDRFVVGAYTDGTGAGGAGSAYLYDLNGTLLAAITNPTPASGDNFGFYVAGVGTNGFVVAAINDDTAASDAGAVYLYDVNGSLLETIIDPAPTTPTNKFGFYVAGLGANRFGVGTVNAGVVHVYDWSGNLLASVANPTPVAGDFFGIAVAGVGANRFLVADYSDDTGATDAGSAYLFDIPGDPYVDVLVAGVRQGGITASMLAAGAVDSAAIADGAIGAADLGSGAVTAASIAAGAVTTAALADGAVTAGKIQHVPDVLLVSIVTNPTPASSDVFGNAVAGVGTNRFVVGAREDNTGTSGAGCAYLYSDAGALLATVTNPALAFSDNFGSAVAGMGINRFVVTAEFDDAGATNAGSAYVYNNSGALLATVTNPTPAVADQFGIVVSGVGTNRFLVGAALDDTGATNAGSAYLYDVNGVLLATVTNPTPNSSDNFGSAVAGVGINHFVVAATSDDTGASNAGSAYLYDFNGALLATLTNPTPASADIFGYAIAMAGTNRFVVGAPNDDTGASNAGAVYLYDVSGTLLATITNPTPGAVNFFGSFLASLGGGLFGVGMTGDDRVATNAGAMYLYDSEGSLLSIVAPTTLADSDGFGGAVAGVGTNRFVVGASSDDHGAADAGSAYLFSLPGSQHAALIAAGVPPQGITSAMILDGEVGTEDLGAGAVGSVAIADGAILTADLGSNAVTTATLDDEAVTAAKVKQAANVALMGTVTNPSPAASDLFGRAVARVGTSRFVVGVTGDDTGASTAGIVYLFDNNGTFLATVTNPAPATGDNFGSAVAGVGVNRFVVGAAADDAGAANAGSVYLYNESGAILATITNPAPTSGDNFGSSVGGIGVNRILVGAESDDTGATNAGSAYVYDINGVLLMTITNPIPANGDNFGSAVAGVGTNRFVVGASGFDEGVVSGAGTAYVYDFNGTLLAEATMGGVSITTIAFGDDVAAVGTGAFVVGAAGFGGGGRAFLFNDSGVRLATITNPTGTASGSFGIGVAGLGANGFVVGASGNQVDGVAAGALYVFDTNGTLTASIPNPVPGPGVGDNFGEAVAGIVEDRLVVGAPNDDTGAASAGTAYIYDLAGGTHADLVAAGVQVGGVTEAMLAASIGVWQRVGAGGTNIAYMAGNVGVGTVAPTNKLHVVGNVQATGFITASDRALKENFTELDRRAVLDKVSALPVTEWNFTDEACVRHVGPMAQDFYQAFGLGQGDTTITTVDADGIALLAIQALRLEKDAEIAELKRQIEELKDLVERGAE